jgi:hypothetical protein
MINAMGYKNVKDKRRTFITDDQKIEFSKIKWSNKFIDMPHTIYINEGAMYELIIKSQLPQAKIFKKWITDVVLPSIRKYGKYKLTKKYERQIYNIRKKINYLQNQNKKLKNDMTKDSYPNGGTFYVIEYIDDDGKKIYRIGSTKTMNKRLSTYTTHTLHKNKVLLTKKIKNPLQLEICVRAMIYEHRYKNNKDFYKCTFQTVKKAVTVCLKSITKMKQTGGSKYSKNKKTNNLVDIFNKNINAYKSKLRKINKEIN